MDSLLLSHQHRPANTCPSSVHPPSVLFRSGSVAASDLLSSKSTGASGAIVGDDESQDIVDAQGISPCPSIQPTNRISLAKALLAEACTSRMARASCADGTLASAAVAAGPLGSLLVLLSTAPSADKACACLTTLSFLLLDRANRKTVTELDGVAIMLDAMRSFPEPQTQLAAVDAIVAVVRHDNAEKERLWQRDSEGTLVGLVDACHAAPRLQRLLRLLNKAAFGTDGSTPVQLLEPRLIPALASLLHPAADTGVLHLALKLLQSAAQCSDAALLSAWLPAIFRMVPLLQEQYGMAAPACIDAGLAQATLHGARCTLDATLQPLLSLSDHDAFRNALLAAGCLPPLLPLLSHSSDTIKVTATCILANLVESSLCREQMCSEAAVHALLGALHVASCTEAIVGLLYILGRLATSRPRVVSILRQHGTAPLTVMMQCNPGDKDVLLGLQQLLELMQATGQASGMTSAQSPEGSGGSGGSLAAGNEVSATVVLRAVDSGEVQISPAADERAKSYMSRSLTQTSSHSSIVNLCALSWL